MTGRRGRSWRPRCNRRRVWAGAVVALLVLGAVNGGRHGSSTPRRRAGPALNGHWVTSRVCDAFHQRVDAEVALESITGSMSLAQVTRLADRDVQAAQRSDAVTGVPTIGRSPSNLRKIRARLIEQWKTVGGPALQRMANDDEETIISEVFNAAGPTSSLDPPGPLKGASAARARARTRLQRRCVPVTDPPTRPLTGGPHLTLLARRSSRRLVQFDMTGRVVKQFHSPVSITASDMRLSPDGHTLASLDESAGSTATITRLDLLTLTSTHHAGDTYVWDENGVDVWAHVALDPDNRSVIGEIGADGSLIRATAAYPGNAPVAAQTPGGDFVYTSTRGIRGFDPGAGDTFKIVAQPGCFLGSANLNPLGDRIVYDALCVDPARSGVYTVGLDGADRHQILVGNVSPVRWSPDGRWIAFSENSHDSTFRGDESYNVLERSRAIFVMRSDGSHVGRVTPTGYDAFDWVPPKSPLNSANGRSASTPTTTPTAQLG